MCSIKFFSLLKNFIFSKVPRKKRTTTRERELSRRVVVLFKSPLVRSFERITHSLSVCVFFFFFFFFNKEEALRNVVAR